MFGVGALEMLVIMILAVIVVGPDRLPVLAADLAKWIRQARAYARHVLTDFNDVVGELEKEAGTSREDWKEITSVFNRQAGAVTQELQKATGASNGSEPATVAPPAITPDAEAEVIPSADSDGEAKPWYMPERGARRRPR